MNPPTVLFFLSFYSMESLSGVRGGELPNFFSSHGHSAESKRRDSLKYLAMGMASSLSSVIKQTWKIKKKTPRWEEEDERHFVVPTMQIKESNIYILMEIRKWYSHEDKGIFQVCSNRHTKSHIGGVHARMLASDWSWLYAYMSALCVRICTRIGTRGTQQSSLNGIELRYWRSWSRIDARLIGNEVNTQCSRSWEISSIDLVEW